MAGRKKSEMRVEKKLLKFLLILNFVLFIDCILFTIYYLIYGLITPKYGVRSDSKGIITWIVIIFILFGLGILFRSFSVSIKKRLELKFSSKVRHGIKKISSDIRSMQIISVILALIILVIALFTVNL
jgi:hypothetical protein